jgi:hypothetical protein
MTRALSALALIGLATSSAFAGYTRLNDVVVVVNGTASSFSGSFGDSRNSSDSKQYIGCHFFAGTGTGFSYGAWCMARDKDNNYAICEAGNEYQLEVFKRAQFGAYIDIEYDSTSGSCTAVHIYPASYVRPN